MSVDIVSTDKKSILHIFGGEVIPVYSNVQNGLGALISTNAQMIAVKPQEGTD